MILRGVRFHPPDRAVDVLDGLRKAELGRHAVIDAEPRVPGVGQHVEQRPDVGALAAFVEASAVNQDGGGKRGPSGTCRSSSSVVAGRREFNALLIERGCREEGQCEEQALQHRERFYQLRLAVQDVGGYVGPELAKHIGQGVAAQGIAVLEGEPAHGPVMAGVIRRGDTLGNAAAEDFRSIEAGVSLVIGRNENPGRRIARALPEAPPLAFGVVARVLMEDCGQSEDDEVISVGLVEEASASSILAPVAGDALAELGMPIRREGQGLT